MEQFKNMKNRLNNFVSRILNFTSKKSEIKNIPKENDLTLYSLKNEIKFSQILKNITLKIFLSFPFFSFSTPLQAKEKNFFTTSVVKNLTPKLRKKEKVIYESPLKNFSSGIYIKDYRQKNKLRIKTSKILNPIKTVKLLEKKNLSIENSLREFNKNSRRDFLRNKSLERIRKSRLLKLNTETESNFLDYVNSFEKETGKSFEKSTHFDSSFLDLNFKPKSNNFSNLSVETKTWDTKTLSLKEVIPLKNNSNTLNSLGMNNIEKATIFFTFLIVSFLNLNPLIGTSLFQPLEKTKVSDNEIDKNQKDKNQRKSSLSTFDNMVLALMRLISTVSEPIIFARLVITLAILIGIILYWNSILNTIPSLINYISSVFMEKTSNSYGSYAEYSKDFKRKYGIEKDRLPIGENDPLSQVSKNILSKRSKSLLEKLKKRVMKEKQLSLEKTKKKSSLSSKDLKKHKHKKYRRTKDRKNNKK